MVLKSIYVSNTQGRNDNATGTMFNMNTHRSKMGKAQAVIDVSTSTFSDENPPLPDNAGFVTWRSSTKTEHEDVYTENRSMNQTFPGTAMNEHQFQHQNQHHQHYGYYSHTPNPHSYYSPHDHYPPIGDYPSYGYCDTRGYSHDDPHYHQPKPPDVPSFSNPYGYNHSKVTDTPGSAHEFQQRHGYYSHSNEFDSAPYPYHDSHGNNDQGTPIKRKSINCDYANPFHDRGGVNEAPQDHMPYSRPAKKRRPKKKPDGMPRYPLSAYNFFFSEEREVVLAMLPLPSPDEEAGDKVEPLPDNVTSTIKPLPDNITSTIKQDLGNPGERKDTMPKFDSREEELQYIKTILSTRKLPKDKTEELQKKIEANTKRILDTYLEGDKVKKSHKKGHGKITFQVLSKLIGQRWRDISQGDVKQHYFYLAKKDTERYNKQMKEYEDSKA